MKDYSLIPEDKKHFILNYKVKGEFLIIKFATGKKFKLMYSRENEQKILEQMRSQVLNGDKFREESVKTRKKITNYLRVNSIALLISLIITAFLFPFILVSGALLVVVIEEIRLLITLSIKINDFDKNKLFIENEEEIKEYVTTTEFKSNCARISKAVTADISLNSVDKMSAREIEEILDNIEIEKTFKMEEINPEEPINPENGISKKSFKYKKGL